MTTVEASLAPRSPALSSLSLAGRLVLRFGPQLMLVALIGAIARALLLEGAVALSFLNRLAGLAFLTLVVLAHLVVVVVLFEIVRPGLPALDAAARGPAEAPPPSTPRRGAAVRRYASSVALALVPFFAFYAAWGFLGDAVRDYSKLALAVTPLGQSANVLDVSGGLWLAASVGVAWGVRRAAKFMRARTGAAAWDVLIVICEAMWAFIGLFVLSNWQDEILAFAAGLPELLSGWLTALAPAAKAAAAAPPPVENAPPDPWDAARSLFFYALYPIVQLTIAALIYGYDVHGAEEPGESRVGRAIGRWRAVPRPARDFVGHFVSGLVKRYRALANGVRLTLGTGVTLIAVTVVGWRLLDWLAAWAWAGAFRLIGPHELVWQQVFADWVSLLLGPPSAPGEGVLLVPFKICLLAAALETAFAGGATFRKAAR
jgi:hypothetical protein